MQCTHILIVLCVCGLICLFGFRFEIVCAMSALRCVRELLCSDRLRFISDMVVNTLRCILVSEFAK